ncbi:jg4228 [Pararge aegeria aegeria]|uniref:Jg4228 protein n=1 Tax=Pararge aegeria aegeria TaxID=348720 RepID=A0A8S4R5V2_9NEOP|nr:jg4228 [Pararge aegeria aegeria]
MYFINWQKLPWVGFVCITKFFGIRSTAVDVILFEKKSLKRAGGYQGDIRSAQWGVKIIRTYHENDSYAAPEDRFYQEGGNSAVALFQNPVCNRRRVDAQFTVMHNVNSTASRPLSTD